MIPFAGSPLNRASERRTDLKWIESKRRDPSSLLLPVWRQQPFLLGPEKSEPPIKLGLVPPGIADSLAGSDAPCIFLGLDGETAGFALDISQADDPQNVGPLAALGYVRDARMAAPRLSMKRAQRTAQANGIVGWHVPRI